MTVNIDLNLPILIKLLCVQHPGNDFFTRCHILCLRFSSIENQTALYIRKVQLCALHVNNVYVPGKIVGVVKNLATDKNEALDFFLLLALPSP